ncbi:wHTH domain-containing protein [Streptomyces atratus]|uniref:wHTH domain-containing protein n=1 Tax=Streptomyces atratus TaxID=1893 RepID=UPI0033DF4655
MGRHLALLIGASDYRSSGSFSSLDFIPAELDRLRRALEARGFDRVDVVARGQGGVVEVGRSQIRGQVNQFLHETAKVGDSLLILLSGHGVHHEGRDLMVPEGLHRYDSATEESVPVDWAKALGSSPATSVVFLLDICREGVREETKSAAVLQPRSRRELGWKLDRVRKVARVFACEPLELSLWQSGSTSEDGTETPSFSLFTRAVTDLVEEEGPPVRLDDLLEKVQGRITELHTLHGKPGPAQRIDHQIAGAHGPGDFVVLPGVLGAEQAPARSYEDHPWTGIVTGHVAWDLVPSPHPPAVAPLKTHCAAVAAHLAALNERYEEVLVDDPWHDPGRAERAVSRLTHLLTGGASPGKRTLLAAMTPTEAALLVLTPFVLETAHRALAADLHRSRAAESAEFDTFTGQFPRERRRMEQAEQAGNAEAVRQIRWWLLRRWLLYRPESYHSAVVEPLIPPAGEGVPQWVTTALGPGQLIRLLNELRLAPFTLSGDGTSAVGESLAQETELREQVVAAPGDNDQHIVRERLVGALLKTALALAVTGDGLPPVVVQNLGFRDQVDLPALLTAVEKAYWNPSGASAEESGKAIVLHARSGDHASTLALELYCGQVDSLLRDIHDQAGRLPDLRPLSTLPVRVSPAVDAPAHSREAIRFRADEERVLDLLMGRNLYKDPELAVRELYQNALDACRHRALRTEYLRRTRNPLPEWEGAISFTQGVDDSGRAYLTCHDTGIGMGVREIRDAFSEAGARFVQMPEYVRERALWQQHASDLRFYPNSRFGIGVLSYFMLADEIMVETRRFTMDGRTGQGLRVRIAGPGSLFRIDSLKTDPWSGDPLPDDPLGGDAGTRVTLYLHPAEPDERPVSCVSALAGQLWVSPFRTVASHGSMHAEWNPYELRPEALIDHHLDRRRVGGYLRLPEPQIVPAEDSRLHWVNGPGILLADGIRTDTDTFGAVIDLREELRPEVLSVDRVDLRKYDERAVERLKREGLPSLISSPVFTYDWVVAQPWDAEEFADDCVRAAAAAGVKWTVGGRRAAVADTGVFPPDELLIDALTGRGSDPVPPGRDDHLLVACIPEPVLRWRLPCLLRAGFGGPAADAERLPTLPTALPSDVSFLLGERAGDGESGWSARHAAWAVRSLPRNLAWHSGNVSPVLEACGVLMLLTLPEWTWPDEIGTSGILGRLSRTGRTAGELAERFRAMGLRVSLRRELAGIGASELDLIRKVGGVGWVEAGASLSWGQLLASAARSGTPVATAAALLKDLGYEPPKPPPGFAEPVPEDAELLDVLLRDVPDAAHGDTPALSPARINVVAAQTNRSPAAVAGRLSSLGFDVPAGLCPARQLESNELIVLSLDLDERSPWLSPDAEVPAPHLLAAAVRTRVPVETVAQWLRALGFAVPAVLPNPSELSDRDLVLLSGSYKRVGNFLPKDRMVRRSHLLDTRERFGIPVLEARERLAELGYRLPPPNPVVDELSNDDHALIDPYIRDSDDDTDCRVVPSSHVRAVAERLGIPAQELAGNLVEMGCALETPPDSYGTTAAGALLLDVLDTAEEDLFGLRLHAGTWISLSELVSVAMRLGRPFREIALEAARHGFRHEAEPWFGEQQGAGTEASP